MASVEALLDVQSQIMRLADDLQERLDYFDIDHAFDDRATLSAEFNSYVAQEIAFVRKTMMKNCDAAIASRITLFVDNCKTVRRQWDDYTTEWTREEAVSDMAAFRSETSIMLNALRSRMKEAAELLCPLAVRSGSVKLRTYPMAAAI